MEKQKFKTTITSKHKLFDLHLRETFRYRDLIWLFVKRDFTALYKQTILGPLWAIIQPLLTTVVFTIIFGTIARLSTFDTHDTFTLEGFLFYMTGTMLWSYFSLNVSKISKVFIDNRATMGKVYYPRLVQPIAISISNLISFGIQFALFAILLLIYSLIGKAGVQATWYILFIPVVLVQMIVLSIGLGMIISAITTKYRDLQMLVAFGLSLWQYITPVPYGLTQVMDSPTLNDGIKNLYLCNPMTPIVTTFRYGVFGHGFFDYRFFLISLAFTVFFAGLGLVLYSKTEKNFMDTI